MTRAEWKEEKAMGRVKALYEKAQSTQAAEYIMMRLESNELTAENLALWIEDHFEGEETHPIAYGIVQAALELERRDSEELLELIRKDLLMRGDQALTGRGIVVDLSGSIWIKLNEELTRLQDLQENKDGE
jgi:cation transport ATPase